MTTSCRSPAEAQQRRGGLGCARASAASVAAVILSDRSIREELAAGRIVIEPFDDHSVQPSSIDVRISNLFRVFRNYTKPGSST